MKRMRFLVVLLFTLAGCVEEDNPVDVPSLSPEEQQVIANCYTVQQAVEAFAAGNNGIYPSTVSIDRNLDGNRLIDLLPGGVLLVNPINGARHEPVDWSADNPGETGYGPIMNNVAVDYTVTGFGETETILVLTKDGPVN